MSDVIIKVENLKGYYKGTFGVVYAVDGVSFEVNKGEILGIAGESGSGKSTLAELITGLPRPLLHYIEGKIIINGYIIWKGDTKKEERGREKKKEAEKRKEKESRKEKREKKKKEEERIEMVRKEVLCKIIGYVPQASMNSLNPVKKIKNLIIDVMKERIGKRSKKNEKLEDLKLVRNHFKTLGLEEAVFDRYPHELSGGMIQRTVIAISTLWNPNLLIVDEPTSALDVSTQKLLINMLLNLKKIGIIGTIIFISHDIPTLRQICTRCVIMYAGKIVEDGSMEDIINAPLHPYTKGLVSSIVSFNPDGSAETELGCIPGKPPDLRKPPPGCRFHPRCLYCMPICKEHEPPFYEPSGEDHPVNCWLYK